MVDSAAPPIFVIKVVVFLFLATISFGYYVPIKTHRCAQIIDVKEVLYDITDDVELRYIVRSEDNDLFLNSVSVTMTEKLKDFIEENKGHYLIIYCTAPSYYGYTAEYLSHSIFDINKDPIPKKEANLRKN